MATHGNAQLALATVRLIDGFKHDGVLKWTNDVLTTAPVYEVYRSSTVTGLWSRLLSLTNQTTTTVTNPQTNGEFYLVGWTSDAQATFDYVFDEGYGLPSVVGELKLTFVPGPALGTWYCEDYLMTEYQHPVGQGSFVSGRIVIDQGAHVAVLAFTPLVGDAGVYLVGEMDVGSVGGRSAYTGFSGFVYRNGIAGTVEIGYFSATRR